MADRLTRGSVHVYNLDVLSINDALQKLVDRIDELQGLRGKARIYDAVTIEEPEEDEDAAQLGNTTDAVTIGGDQEITGDKTFTDSAVLELNDGATFRFEDTNGTLIHAWGTAT